MLKHTGLLFFLRPAFLSPAFSGEVSGTRVEALWGRRDPQQD